MMTKFQVELAKILWEQSRQAALYADESWRILMQSQMNILDSFRNAGFPFAAATTQFDQFIEDHSRRYKAALEQMDKMANDYFEAIQKNA